MSSGKASELDGLPAGICKHGGRILVEKLTQLYSLSWRHEAVPKDFKDATIIHVYKRKGDRSICDNYRGISLLSTAENIMACNILNRLTKHVSDNILPETHCGFRSSWKLPT